MSHETALRVPQLTRVRHECAGVRVSEHELGVDDGADGAGASLGGRPRLLVAGQRGGGDLGFPDPLADFVKPHAP